MTRFVCIPVSLCALLAACSIDSAPGKREVSGASMSVQRSALDCEALGASGLGVPGVRVTQSETVAASWQSDTQSDNYPEHCVIAGKLNERTGADGKPYGIGFELRLPRQWNRRFFFQGGGGADGFILPAYGTLTAGYHGSNALTQGYAVVAMDSGHTMEDSSAFGGSLFGLEPQARLDYGYQALGTMTRAAKQMIEHAYGDTIERSYFVGCSNGGRQALMVAARYPQEFDGVVAGDPGLHLPKAAVQHAWDFQQLSRVNASVPDSFNAAEMALLGQRVLAKCDALDGASDGLVQDTEKCASAFDLEADVPTCSDPLRSGTCLSAAQKTAVRNIMGGPVNGKGEALYSDWPWDPALASEDFMGWRGWKLGYGWLDGFSLILLGGAGSLAYVFTTPPTDLAKLPNAENDSTNVLRKYLLGFDFDRDAPKIFAVNDRFQESAMSFMTPPDATHLSGFAARSSKLIVYHGTGDPVFSANDSARWYRQLRENVPDAERFARLYLVPGMTHCGGGPSLDSFDLFASAVDWVEQGRAPQAVVTRVSAANTSVPVSWPLTRTRPLCPYPQHAQLRAGATDLESAASFVCQ